MTDAMMSLKGLIEKTPDADILREMIFAAERLMETEVGAQRLPARRAPSAVPSVTAIAIVPGRREPARSSCASPSCAPAAISPAFSSRGGWRRRP